VWALAPLATASFTRSSISFTASRVINGINNGFRVQGITCRKSVGPSHKLAEEFFVDLSLNDDSASIRANLALRKEGSKRRGAHSVVRVHVVEDNHRIETAKFQRGPLQGTPSALRQRPCGLDSADQIDYSNFGTIEELVCNGAGGFWPMSNNINTPAGKPASSATSASITPAEIGANSDGLTTTVFPAATGDMTARQDSTLAPFHGVKLATTPSGGREPAGEGICLSHVPEGLCRISRAKPDPT
jgi:hypothetical protein